MSRKLSDGEGKTASVAFRTTPGLKAKLEKAAAEAGRSIAQELEVRLESSFGENRKGLLTTSSPLQFASLSFLRTAELCLLDLVRLSGKSWAQHRPTRDAARAALKIIFDAHIMPDDLGPVASNEREEADRLITAAKALAGYLSYTIDFDEYARKLGEAHVERVPIK